jgi:hypothetical protein
MYRSLGMTAAVKEQSAMLRAGWKPALLTAR